MARVDPRALLRKAAAKIGIYRPYAVEESAIVRTNRSVSYDGDVPAAAANARTQFALKFAKERLSAEKYEDVVYGPNGMAWQGRCLIRAASAREPSFKDLSRVLRRRRLKNFVEWGWVFESTTPYTYGDWFAGQLRSLVRLNGTYPPGPLILPHFLAEKSYIVRDLSALNVEFIVADKDVFIENCTVVREMFPRYELGIEDVHAYRKAFGIQPIEPKPGSILYLARFDHKFEVKHRIYPSKRVAKIIDERGGHVFDTLHATPQRLSDLAPYAETVVADQGSAIFGVVHWKPKRLLELTTDNWWNSANVFIGRATGIETYRVKVIDEISDNDLTRELLEFLPTANTL